MTCFQEETKVLYHSKDREMEKSFYGVEWLAAMTSDMPDKEGVPPLAGVRYYR